MVISTIAIAADREWSIDEILACSHLLLFSYQNYSEVGIFFSHHIPGRIASHGRLAPNLIAGARKRFDRASEAAPQIDFHSTFFSFSWPSNFARPG